MYNLENDVAWTTDLKNAFKHGITRARIIYEGNIITEDTNIVSVEIEDNRYVPDMGFIGQATSKMATIVLKDTTGEINLENKSFQLLIGADYQGTTYYINYGTFIVNELPQVDVTNGQIKIVAFDYMIKFNLDYQNQVTYPCTMKELLENICEQAGVELGTEHFANEDFIVENNQFEGKTLREVLQNIAKSAFSWARIGQDDKLYLDFEVKDIDVASNISETITIDEYETDGFKKANEYYGEVNKVVYGQSDIQGQEEYVEDAESIAEYGINQIVINDNYFAYTTQKRAELIQAGTRLFGLKYMPIQELKLIGLAYLDCRDVIKVQDLDNTENYYYIIPFNHKIKYNGVLYDSISSENSSINEQVYENKNTNAKSTALLEIIVDRAMKEIKAIVEYYVNFLHNKSGNNNIFIGDTRDGEGYITKFVIKGSTTYFTGTNITIVASEGIQDEETILLTEDGDTLITEDADTILLESKSLYVKSKQIVLDDILRSLTVDDTIYYDELQILQDGTIQIVRRIGVSDNQTLYLLDEEEITILEDKFVLPSKEQGLYYFVEEIDNLDYYAEYIIKNEYSDVLATEAYVNAGLELKVDTEKLVSELNASADIIRLIGERLIIEMQNFSLDQYGNMRTTNGIFEGTITSDSGNIAGFNITSNEFSKEYNTLYNFTVQDIQLLLGYLNGTNDLTTSLKSLYDVTGDGTLNILDVVRMINIMNGTATNEQTINGAVSIKSDDINSLIKITNDLSIPKIRMGVFSFYSYLVSADVISLTEPEANGVINGIILDKENRKITVTDEGNKTTILATGITTPTVTQTSKESDKKNFEKLNNALEEVMHTDIYKYNLKSQENEDKKHIGFVIGKDFKYSHLITVEDENKEEIGVDPYSMVSVLWRAVQEQQEQIEQLQKEIKILKGEN